MHKRTFLVASSCVLLATGLAGAWARTSGEERRRQKTRRRTATKEKKGHLDAIARVWLCLCGKWRGKFFIGKREMFEKMQEGRAEKDKWREAVGVLVGQ